MWNVRFGKKGKIVQSNRKISDKNMYTQTHTIWLLFILRKFYFNTFATCRYQTIGHESIFMLLFTVDVSPSNKYKLHFNLIDGFMSKAIRLWLSIGNRFGHVVQESFHRIYSDIQNINWNKKGFFLRVFFRDRFWSENIREMNWVFFRRRLLLNCFARVRMFTLIHLKSSLIGSRVWITNWQGKKRVSNKWERKISNKFVCIK